MKPIVLIVSFLCLISCNSQKKIAENGIQQDANYTFIYTKNSRAFGQTTTVTAKETIISKRGEEKTTATPTTPETWKTLTSLAQQLDLSTLKDVKAPSTKNYTDAAAAATLTVVYKDVTYKTPQFDHGNPPEKIAPIVQQLVALTETYR